MSVTRVEATDADTETRSAFAAMRIPPCVPLCLRSDLSNASIDSLCCNMQLPHRRNASLLFFVCRRCMFLSALCLDHYRWMAQGSECRSMKLMMTEESSLTCILQCVYHVRCCTTKYPYHQSTMGLLKSGGIVSFDFLPLPTSEHHY